jgi:hypothetical protein
MVDITETTVQTDHAINTTLPNSEFLTANNTLAALRAAGRETLLYAATVAGNALQLGNLRPIDIINRYVDSGIPVSIWPKIKPLVMQSSLLGRYFRVRRRAL